MKRKNYHNYLVIALFIFLIYGKSVFYTFNLDDNLVTVGNERVEKGFEGIPALISGYYHEDNMGYKYGYRPVSQITFAIEYQFLGENPHFSHFVNVLLYILICALIFYFFNTYAAFKYKWLALAITLLFAVHPLHVEAVASIKNREELLAFLFPFVALLIALKAVETKKWYLFVLVAGFNFLAIYSKQSSLALIVSAPLLIVLIGKLNLSQIFLTFISFYPFLFLAVKDSLDFERMAVVFAASGLVFIVFSLLIQNTKTIKAFLLVKLKKQRSKLLLLVIILSSIFIAYQGYFYFILFSLIPLFLLVKFKSDNYIKLAFVLPLILFLMLGYEYSTLGLVVLLLFISDWFTVKVKQFTKIKVFLFVFVVLSVYVSISKGALDLRYIPLVIYLLIHFLPNKFSILKKYFIGVLPIIYFVDLFPFPQELQVDKLIVFFLSIYLVLVHFNVSLKHKAIHASALFLSCLFFFIFYHIQFDSNVNLSSLTQESEMLINPNYEHQIRSFEARVIDFTENPYYYYNNQTDQNGLVLSSVVFYLKKLVAPFPLSSYYGYDTIQPIRIPLHQYLILGLLALFFAVLTYFFRKKNLMLWMLLIALVSLLSISNYYEVVSGIVADRLAFTLVLAFSTVLLFLVYSAFKNNSRISYAFSVLIILVFTICSFIRVSKWESPKKLFSADVQSYPNSAKLHTLVANTIMIEQTSGVQNINLNQVKKAKHHLEQSIAIYPDYFNSYYDLARVNELLNEKEAAIKNYSYVIKKDSSFYDVYLALTDLYIQINNKQAAADNLQAYINRTGYSMELYFELSNLAYQLTDYQKVIKLNKEIILNNPQVPEAYLNIAYAYGKLTDLEKLNQYLKLGEQLAPNHLDAKEIRRQFL